MQKTGTAFLSSQNARTRESAVGLAARLVVGLALSMLLIALWNPYLISATQWGPRELRVMPAVSISW